MAALDQLQGLLTQLKSAREAKGLSLADLTELTGMDRSAISKLETGQRANPTVDTLVRYAEAAVALSRAERKMASASLSVHSAWPLAMSQSLHASPVRSVVFSRDGSRLASGSADQTIHVFDARPWTPELRRQREALGLVEYFCQKLKLASKEKVAERIRADNGISEGVRHEALDLLEVYWPRLSLDP